LSDLLDFLSWIFTDRGPTDLGGLVFDFACRPSFYVYFIAALPAAALLVWGVLRLAFPRGSRLGPPRWGAGAGLLATLLARLSMGAVHMAVFEVFRNLSSDPADLIEARSFPIANIICAPLLCLAGYFILKVTARARAADVGLVARGGGRNFARGLLLLLALLPLVALLAKINALFLNTVGADMSEQRVVEIMRSETSPLFLGLMIVVALLSAPIWEEFIFRGVLYNGLRRSLGRDEAILISALIFGFIHGAVISFVPIFLLAIFLAYAYERTGSLITPIAMHFLFNLWSVLLMHLT